jgi:hypothetical protein
LKRIGLWVTTPPLSPSIQSLPVLTIGYDKSSDNVRCDTLEDERWRGIQSLLDKLCRKPLVGETKCSFFALRRCTVQPLESRIEASLQLIPEVIGVDGKGIGRPPS